MNSYFLIGILTLVPIFGWGQIGFRNESGRLPVQTYISSLAKAVVDVNKDGFDDIIRTGSAVSPNTQTIYIDYQLPNGNFRTDSIIGLNMSIQQSIAVADIDRNGFNDLIMGGGYDGVHVFKNTANTFTQIDLSQPRIMMQAANLVDINNDGWLDYFACHDLGINQIWANDQKGNLLPVSDWIDLATVPTSNNSGNYGSVWTDIDNDGDLDLYIAKCSIFAMGYPNDPRRINMLFINDGNGHYSEQAAQRGLNINGQSWTADFADIDNDGDMDCFVTNHEAPSMMLENDGTGHFSDITAATGIINLGKPLQAIMRDFDNDGYVDLMVSGEYSVLYRNNGNKTFTEETRPFDEHTIKSFAVGDLNHDGFLDLYTSYHDYQLSSAGVLADRLWLNQPNGNHYFGVKLEGSQSNPNGVGAKIIVISNGQKQIREVRAGEGYGMMNSLTQYIGLGLNATIDTLEVFWPSGQKSSFSKINANQILTIQEPNCQNSGCIPISVVRINLNK